MGQGSIEPCRGKAACEDGNCSTNPHGEGTRHLLFEADIAIENHVGGSNGIVEQMAYDARE